MIDHTNKPAVLFILHLPPPVHGAAMVGKYIHDSRIINESFSCHYINLTTAKDLTDIGKVGLGKLKHFVGLLRQIRSEVRRLHPDLVYVTPNACGGAFYKDFIVVQLLKRMGCRVVVHYHNKGVSTRQDHWLDDRLYRHFFRGIQVILLADALYQDVKKYVARKDVHICPNGIPHTAVCEEVEVFANGDIPRLLFLSNMMSTKGVWDLLEALSLLHQRGLCFECDFVGGWKDVEPEAFKARVKECGLTGSVRAHGVRYGMDKERFFQQADIFVFPTFYANECFPLVLLEAMMHGLTCVSTDEGGIAGIITQGRTGLIVQRHSPESLAMALEQLLSDRDLCRSMGEAGRIKFLGEFTLECFEHRLTEILKECVCRYEEGIFHSVGAVKTANMKHYSVLPNNQSMA